MKRLIAPIAIIVALIAFFVIIDRKEFSRHDNVRTVQNENPSTNRKPLVSVPETKPVTDVKPAVETKSVETKPGEKLLPAAAPVVTAEEAEMNEDAKAYVLAEKEKKEPFYKDYANLNLETVSFQGTIRAISKIPDPETNDYPNCLYSVFVELDSILTDTPLSNKVSYEVILNIPIMKDKRIKKDNILQPGDMVMCDCAEYDTMPQSIQEIQLSDDIQSFEHQQYYALRIEKISGFKTAEKKDFAKKEITILPIQTQPKDEKSTELRHKRIQEEIQRIEDEITKHGGTFDAWKKEYKPIADKYNELCSSGFKGWINDSYFSARGSETTYRTKEYIEWILPYKKYLEQNNIDLIILRYPSRSDFAARVLSSDDFQENPAWVEHYYECLKNDIEIIDPMPMMWENRFNYPLFYFYGHETDIHPFEGELKVAAESLSRVLKDRYDYTKDYSLSFQKRAIKQPLYLYPEGNSHFASDLPIEFDGVSRQDKPIGYLSANSGSPFLFLSSSVFGYRAMQALGASVPHYSSFFLQTIVDWKYQSGVENSMIRNLVSSPGLLNNRRVVIMVGRYSSWKSGPNIPKYLFENVDKITFYKKYDFHSPDISVTSDSCKSFITDDGILDVSKDPSNRGSLSVKIDIRLPSLPNHNAKTYMIRVNLKDKNRNTILELYSNTKKIDFAQLSNQTLDKTDLSADLIVPITATLSSVQIVASSGKNYSIKDIEIWYY